MDALLQRLKSKTYWTAIIGALLVIIEQNSALFSTFIPASYRSMAVLAWPILMIALREVTTVALADK